MQRIKHEFGFNKSTADMMPGASCISENLSNPLDAAPAKTEPIKRNKSNDKTKTLLPADFQPSEFSVICGNKKRAVYERAGNKRFRAICKMHLKEFMDAPTKHEKSFVVTKVMKMLRNACPVGAFVAFEKERWWEVSDRTSREKVGTFFRDCLTDKYKSSSKNKLAMRKMKKSSSDLSANGPSAAFHAPQATPNSFYGAPQHAPIVPFCRPPTSIYSMIPTNVIFESAKSISAVEPTPMLPPMSADTSTPPTNKLFGSCEVNWPINRSTLIDDDDDQSQVSNSSALWFTDANGLTEFEP